jgi:hypothetical protein
MALGRLIRSDEAGHCHIPHKRLAGANQPEMHAMPMRGELSICPLKSRRRASATERVCAWIVATIKNPEFLMIALFCAVGLWLTFYFVHFVPEFGGMVESLEQISE